MLGRGGAAAGVPRDRWVFPWAGAQGNDHWFVTERDELHRSPAIRLAGEALRAHVGADYDHVDLYSCFPSAVQIAARELGLGLDRPLTATGGLTFAGGPGNNYADARHRRAGATGCARSPDAVGLATALGWYVTKHALGVYSCREPPSAVPRRSTCRTTVDALPRVRGRRGLRRATATVESYTALYERDGSPGHGHRRRARLGDGRRAVAKSHDAGRARRARRRRGPARPRRVRVTAPEGFRF